MKIIVTLSEVKDIVRKFHNLPADIDIVIGDDSLSHAQLALLDRVTADLSSNEKIAAIKNFRVGLRTMDDLGIQLLHAKRTIESWEEAKKEMHQRGCMVYLDDSDRWVPCRLANPVVA